MEYYVRIYNKDEMKEIQLAEIDFFSIGSGINDTYQIMNDSIPEGFFTIQKRNNKWYAKCSNKKIISVEKQLENGDTFVLNKKERIAIRVFSYSAELFGSFNLNRKEQVVIGRLETCDIVLPSKQVSGSHAIIKRKNNEYLISDDNSKNGTFVNGKRVTGYISLQDGDVISICDFSIHYQDGILSLGDTNDEEPGEKNTLYPHWFSPSPRLAKKLPSKAISIQNPPQMPAKLDRSIWEILASPGTMIIAMGLSAILGVMAPTSLILMIPMSVVSIVLGIVNKNKAKKKYETEVKEKTDKYHSYIQKTQKQIANQMKEQSDILNYDAPSVDECIRMVKSKDIRMWSYRLGESGFMSVRLGVGNVATSFEVKGPQENYENEDDEFYKISAKLLAESKSIKNVPIVCDFLNEKLVGVIGQREDAVRLVKNMIISASFNHSYEDLKIITIYSKNEKSEWDWIKWLPHSFSDDRDYRFINGNGNPAELLKTFEENLKQRSMENLGRDASIKPYFLFVFTESEISENQTIMKYLLSKENLSAGAIFLYDNMRFLPKECNTILEVKDGVGKYIRKNEADDTVTFRIDKIDNTAYEKYSRLMAPIRIPTSGSTATLPNSVTFLEGFHARTPEELHVENRWLSIFPNETMAVPIGIKSDGTPFFFDIHEKQHGPHGMVAGMTGSGKSEMVQSWILSMSVYFSPQDVNFVLIDFKGTGLILPFKNLPHIAGTISDLDQKIGRNLIALENELSRRKALLDKYGVNNINNYLKLYHQGKADEPLPFLFIIIDEFAEFKVQFPEFMTVVDRIFAIGRTLGVFTILLTQKPAGVVNDKMNANTRFRWCLKVANSSDSKEMLHHADAAKITVPGRAYVQVGEDEIYELIQSYYSGASYRPDIEDKASLSLNVSFVAEDGTKTHFETKTQNEKDESGTSEIHEVVEYLHNYVQNSNFQMASQVWMQKLSYHIYLEDILESNYQDGEWNHVDESSLKIVAGMLDDPANQTQYPLVFDLTKDGHVALFGAPGTGKTTILQTMVMALVRTYSPLDVNIYIMDFGGWSMNIFRQFPHVGGIANDNEDVKIEKMVQLLDRMLSERKQKFSDIGVNNLQGYKQATGVRMPNIVLMLDNFAPVLQLHPELDTFFIRLTREGGNYGMYFIVTTGTPMSLTFKINQNIKMSAAFSMADKSDYAGIVGKTGGLEPENVEGRGLIKAMPPLEFQAALPIAGELESDRVKKIKALAEEMSSKWTGLPAKGLPIMPELIPYGSVGYSGSGIMLGLSSKAIEPVDLPDDFGYYFPILGFPGTGKTNMLTVLAKQYAMKEHVTIVYANFKHQGLEDVEDYIYLETAEDVDEYFEELIPLLQERLEIHKNEPDVLFEPIYILLDDFSVIFESISNLTGDRFDQIIRNGNGLNVNLIITDNADSFAAKSNQGEQVCLKMKSRNQAILIGGNMIGYTSYSANMSGIEKSQMLAEYEAYLLKNNNTVKFKTMSAK